MYPDISKNGYFFPSFLVAKKYATTRSVLESFSPVNTKRTKKRWKYDRVVRGSSM